MSTGTKGKSLLPEKRDASVHRLAVESYAFAAEELLEHLVRGGPRPPFGAGKQGQRGQVLY